MCAKKGVKAPPGTAITVDDMKAIVAEIAGPGSQVDTLLVCINAQCAYYPSRIGDLRGSLVEPKERETWPVYEQQRFRNMSAMLAKGDDPYAALLAEAKRRGMEALLTFRMNDAHGCKYLYCRLWLGHPECRLGAGLDFSRDVVRDYTFRLIEEAVHRYDSDGIEMDFVRFPNFFQSGTESERISHINALVRRVRQMVDAEGKKRGKRLVLAARVPTSYSECKRIGLDPVVWAKEGWIDFLTVSEFFNTRYDLPVKPWKALIRQIPIYGSIEALTPATPEKPSAVMTPADYRRAARHLWSDGADGIYLFNFFIPREVAGAPEPPFCVLKELGDPKMLQPK
jgi:hypothetical protein